MSDANQVAELKEEIQALGSRISQLEAKCDNETSVLAQQVVALHNSISVMDADIESLNVKVN
ncbi:hypothetical protein ACT3OH_15950 [Vreelandella zhanjiangensis]|uniref:hypothetical protein n=1 Tax=Vreelandella zhanjiangensis TaxID=1121960 RepID=UPI00402AE9D6